MSTDEPTPTEQPTLLELAAKQIRLAEKEHTVARLATREKEDELSAVIQGIRYANHTTDADKLAAMIAKQPALDIILHRLRVAEREAEKRVRDAEDNYASLEEHVTYLRDQIAAAPKQEVQIRRKQRDADEGIRQAQAARDALDREMRQHEAHLRWLVAELRRHTRKDVEDSSLFAASK